MIQRSDYWQTASYFLVTTILISLAYMFLLMLPPLVGQGTLLAFATLIGWMARGIYDQRSRFKPIIIMQEPELQRLREMHRRGDG